MNRKYNSETWNVKWSTIVLSVSLLLVYIVLFYVKWDYFKSLSEPVIIDNNSWLILSEMSDLWKNVDVSVTHLSWDSSSQLLSWDSSTNLLIDSWSWNDTWLIVVNEIDLWQWNSKPLSFDIWWVSQLPWTHTYYGDLDFVNLLWISYKYALTDSKWIYYLNMDGYTYDFSDIARKLWWNLYIMNTESEILANKMFGNKVTYINIPDYTNKKVLMLIDINNQSRLLAVDYSIYHQSKSYLQSLFIY